MATIDCKKAGEGMFGYVKPMPGELKVKEYEFYKAAYCGLCRALKKKSKILPFTLSYDFVFLAILRLAVSGEKTELTKIRCVAHPMKKKPALAVTPALEVTASSAALLVYYKFKDDAADKKGIKRLASRFLAACTGGLRKKCLGDGSADQKISESLAALAAYEKEGSPSAYPCAEAFGVLLGQVFCEGVEDIVQSRCLYEIGRHIGRWIYLLDAADDAPDDAKSGSYNPFVCSGEWQKDDFAEAIEIALNCELAEAEKAIDLLTITDKGLLNILQNILYFGMPAEAKKCLKKRYGGEKDCENCENDSKGEDQ